MQSESIYKEIQKEQNQTMSAFDVQKDVWVVAQMLAARDQINEITMPYVEASQIYKPLDSLADLIGRPPDEVMAVFISVI